MSFLPLRAVRNDSERKQENGIEDLIETKHEKDSQLTDEEESVIWDMPISEKELSDHHTDSYLQTNLEKEVLQRRLFRINQVAKSVMEEQGYSVLYLALGFLEWAESDSASQARRAPLILVPVELERKGVRSVFKIQWTGDDVQTNYSLKHKLTEFGVDLPELNAPNSKTDLDEYFDEVKEAIEGLNRWRLISDAYLGFFSFAKYVMFKDLDQKSWPESCSIADHPLVSTILNPDNAAFGTSDLHISDEEIDRNLSSNKAFHIMDADPSQACAIELVKNGANLVVEGPPGTGKSQTITNVIAELISEGKKVLFVSEKMAALEVVKSRLDKAGVGDFCLELHSRKTNKKDFIETLKRSIENSVPTGNVDEGIFSKHEKTKTSLNEYAKALREPIGAMGMSPFSLYTLVQSADAHFKRVDRQKHYIKMEGVDKYSRSQYADSISALESLVDALDVVKPISRNFWRGCTIKSFIPSDREEILATIGLTESALSNLTKALNEVVETCGAMPIGTFGRIDTVVSAAKTVQGSYQTDKDVLLSNEWNQRSSAADALIAKIRERREQINCLKDVFKKPAFDSKDIAKVLADYREFCGKFMRIFNKRYSDAKRRLNELYLQKPPKSSDAIFKSLEAMIKFQLLTQDISNDREAGTRLFGNLWRGTESNAEELEAFSNWVVEYRRQIVGQALSATSAELISTGTVSNNLQVLIKELEHARRGFDEAWQKLQHRLCIDQRLVSGVLNEKSEFTDTLNHIREWKASVDGLLAWSRYVSIRERCMETMASAIIPAVEEDGLESDDILPCFELSVAESLLSIAFRDRPALAEFLGSLHEKKIAQFQELDMEIIKLNRKRLTVRLANKRPKVSPGASDGSAAGILLGEMHRQRGHMPIRKLFHLAGGLIQELKPCFMMSPMSIAQFLEPGSMSFDVILFDEASQVKPYDALGALARGKQLVVMGDSRQLPPTSFFDHLIETAEEDGESEDSAQVGDVESILQQCKRCFPSKTLQWHYRSRHHSLIAVSNQEFYENRLLIYPSAVDKSEYFGLHHVHTPEARYDLGRSSVNRDEAKRVAKAAIEHYRKHPGKSLGVGTFNIKQQQAILEQIELEMHLNPEMEEYFSSEKPEHFFVKNLETIQGDERDVIFISVGFGFTSDGTFRQNFGPLGKSGGERRLNVLITRARERCVIYSNFKAADVRIKEDTRLGVRAFKTYLEYAESGKLISPERVGSDTDSPFEDAVYDFLRDNGFEVRKQVGCAGFWIDLAIVHPRQAGRYALAVECDGAKYHSAMVARDRDRLREQILRGFHWRIHRIWSTDWYRNRAEAEKSLLEAARRATEELPLDVDHLAREPARTATEAINPENDLSKSENSSLTQPRSMSEENGFQAPLYVRSKNLGFKPAGELLDCRTALIAKAVESIVLIESPVHIEEVVRGIREIWGLRRTGSKISAHVMQGIRLACEQGLVKRKGHFLWSNGMTIPNVRKRVDDPPPKIDLICDEEVFEASKRVLEHQHATLLDDLVKKACRILGINATHEDTSKRIKRVITSHIEAGSLAIQSNGMVYFRSENS